MKRWIEENQIPDHQQKMKRWIEEKREPKNKKRNKRKGKK